MCTLRKLRDMGNDKNPTTHGISLCSCKEQVELSAQLIESDQEKKVARELQRRSRDKNTVNSDQLDSNLRHRD